MARVKVDLPERFCYATEIPVRIGDINYGGHLGNDAVLAIAHEARVRFLAGHGWSEKDVDGVGIIMADAAVVFRSEAFHGEVLRAEVAVTDIGRSACDMVYRLTERDSGREVARIKTGLVFFDYGRRKPVGIPEGFRAVAGR